MTAVDFDYKCPRCRSEDIDIYSDGEYSWANDNYADHLETWRCMHCNHYFGVEAHIIVRSRTIQY